MATFFAIIQRIFSVTLLLTILSSGNNGSIWLPIVGTSGETTLEGKNGPITITRDDAGVPHIRAATEADAQFGLGYVHAQDRLWQMEWQRRLASGRTAEFLGAPGLEFDVFFRTVGIRRAAEAALPKLSARDRVPLDAYAAGINLFLNSTPSQQLPPEFGILSVTPEPWTVVDLLAFGRLFAWGNGSNWDKELLREQLAMELGSERAAQLTPAYLADGPTILQEPRTKNQESATKNQEPNRNQFPIPGSQFSVLGSQLLALHRSVATQTGIGADGRGSNSWVVSGERTTTGKPLLANDPHLSAQSPGIWYMAHLSWPNNTVIGATVPGGPGVQIGHNNQIAWGVTTINVDSQDVYVEQINDRNEALFQGTWEPMQIVPEMFKVKGQANVNYKVRITRHGPLLSDALVAARIKNREPRTANEPLIDSRFSVRGSAPERAFPTALAVRWTGHDAVDVGMSAALALNRAQNWTEFTQTFRDYRFTDQNYIYADTAGTIGYIAGGTIPIRAKGDGSRPALGWTGEYEWNGYVPWERLPQTLNPPEGYIVSANNKVIGDEYPYLISNSYAAPYRAARIVEMLESKGKAKLSPDDMAAMQADVLALHARRIMPMLLRTTPGDARGQQALDLLKTWDFRATGESAATAVFEAWYIRIAQRLFEDELGELWDDYSSNLYFTAMATETALTQNQPWCDDVNTPATETCADTVQAALSDGLADMAAAQGSEDIATWRWEKAHIAVFAHQPLGGNAQVGPLFNRTVPNGGDRFTVNVASSFHEWNDYIQTHAAQYRQIVDFANFANSRWIVAPGQGGNPKKPHYDDLLTRWQRAEYLPMR